LGGGINSFLYVGGASLRFTDRLGLSPDCSDPEDCCKKANANGLLNGVGGTVVCCNGKKFACAGPHRFGPGGPIARDCAKAHEDEHLPKMFCFGGAGPRHADSTSDQNNLECPAYKVEIKCLKKGLAGCGMDTACTQYVKDTIATKITKGWDKYKCGLML
jgi:hypothetical protein